MKNHRILENTQYTEVKAKRNFINHSAFSSSSVFPWLLTMDKLSLFNQNNSRQNHYSDLKTGWIVKVYQKIKEGDKTRIQAFEGIIIARKHGNEPGGTITVRKMSGNIGVEKTFPLHLPTITKIEVTKRTGARKSKLYYLRDKSAREIRRKMKVEQVASVKEAAST